MRSNLIDIACTLEHETLNAWLINDGKKDVWIPKSVGELERQGKVYMLTLPEKWALEKGLI